MRRAILLPLAGVLLAVGAGWWWLQTVGPGAEMTRAAQQFLASLAGEQSKKATLGYDDPKRVNWHFIPLAERKGLQIKEMNGDQRKLAHAVLHSALSQVGYDKASGIMELEKILRELESGMPGKPIRDPERYYFTIFGTPHLESKWGLSIEGHHMSLNFVVSGGKVISSTPSMFGANPAEVKTEVAGAPKIGTRLLRDEEERAFALVNSLTDEQKKLAIIADKAPAEVREAGKPQPPDSAAEGIPASKLTEAQVKMLWTLLEAYAHNVPKEVGLARLDAVREAGISKVHFAWAGATKPGVGHYYRVQGPTFQVEFVNTQPDAAGNIANHIHCMWRQLGGDFAAAK